MNLNIFKQKKQNNKHRYIHPIFTELIINVSKHYPDWTVANYIDDNEFSKEQGIEQDIWITGITFSTERNVKFDSSVLVYGCIKLGLRLVPDIIIVNPFSYPETAHLKIQEIRIDLAVMISEAKRKELGIKDTDLIFKQ